MVLDKRDGSYWLIGFYKVPHTALVFHFNGIGWLHLAFVLPHHLHIVIEQQCGTDDHTQTHLTQYLEPSCQPILISLLIIDSLALGQAF